MGRFENGNRWLIARDLHWADGSSARHPSRHVTQETACRGLTTNTKVAWIVRTKFAPEYQQTSIIEIRFRIGDCTHWGPVSYVAQTNAPETRKPGRGSSGQGHDRLLAGGKSVIALSNWLGLSSHCPSCRRAKNPAPRHKTKQPAISRASVRMIFGERPNTVCAT